MENYRSADIDIASCKVEISRFFACVAELGRNIRDSRQENFNAQAAGFVQAYVCVCGNKQLKQTCLKLDKKRFRTTAEYKILR